MAKNFVELKKGVCILSLKSTHQVLNRINENKSTYCGETAVDQGLKWKTLNYQKKRQILIDF